PLEIEVVRGGLRLVRFETLRGLAAEVRGQRVPDRERDFLLNRENVPKFAFERVRPKMIAATDIDQLRGNAQLRSRPTNAAFQDGPGIKCGANLPYIALLPLESEHRCAGD